MLDNYIDPVSCKEHKLRFGLPSLEEFKEIVEKHKTNRYFFVYGDGSGMTTIWGHIENAKINWFAGANSTGKLNDQLVCYMESGFTWPIDKYGNKV
jgi:hypothetical protein